MSKSISKLEEYWNLAQLESLNDEQRKKYFTKFNTLLKGFSGYIVRKNWCWFRQKSELFEELRDKMICKIYEKLPEFDPEKGNFLSFIQTYMRGEGTKFFNKFLRENQFSSTDDSYDELYNYDLDKDYHKNYIIIDKIIKEYNLKITAEEVLYYILHKNTFEKVKPDISELRLVCWLYLEEVFGIDKIRRKK